MADGRRRVWVVTECYPRPGAQTHCIFAHRQLTGVRAAGWDVSVLLPNGWYPPGVWRVAERWRSARQASVPPGFAPDGISVRDLRYRNIVPNRLSRPREYPDLVRLALDRHLNKMAAQPRSDLLLAQFALPFGPIVRASAMGRGLAYAVYLRGDDVWIWPHNGRGSVRAFGEVVRGASLVLSVSEALLREARRLADDELRQGVVVANGIDVSLFRPATDAERALARVKLEVRAGQSVVVCVATAIERKGWRDLLMALALMGANAPALIAVTAGRGDLDLPALRDSLAANVELITRHDVDAQELSGIYHASDVFCLPSHGEGMSNAVLEALACGLPVITTPVGGHPEVIESGVDGQLVPPREVDTLAIALRDMLEDPRRRAMMGRAARRRAEAIGTSGENGARVASLFDAVLDRASIKPDLMRSSYTLVTPN